jgi:triacylglycerol lipase
LLLVHGVGLRDNWRFRYWGRIPHALIAHGARVHYGFQDALGSVESNALTLRDTLLATLTQTDCEKVNIIAHSKGGLDARHLASLADCASHIASITTIASPHAGSRTMDAIMRIPKPLLKATAVPVNGVFHLLGDRNPDFYTVCSQLTTDSMRQFNDEHPLDKDVFCQSYASVMNKPLQDPVMTLPHLVVRHFDGLNDGLVAATSAPFGSYKGMIGSEDEWGVSHCDLVDRRRTPLHHGCRAANDDSFDIVDWYITLVSDLKTRGL